MHRFGAEAPLRRPILWFAGSFISGIAVSHDIPGALPSLFLLIAAGIGIRLVSRHAPDPDDSSGTNLRRHVIPAVCLLLLAGGFALHAIQAAWLHHRHEAVLAVEAGNEASAVVTGRVFGRRSVSGERCRLVVEMDGLVVDGRRLNRPIFGYGRVMVSFPLPGDQSRIPANGATVLFRGTAAVPDPARSPGGFDRRQWLAARWVGLEVESSGVPEETAPPPPFLSAGGIGFARLGDLLHDCVERALFRYMPQGEAALLFGMLLGDTDALDEAWKESFQLSGLMHIMAVSGANVAFLITPIVALLSRSFVGRRASGVVALPVLIVFVLATGMEASVVRAAWMAFFLLVGHMVARKADLACALALTSMVLLIRNTFLLFDVGFQMSFLAVAGIILLEKPMERLFPRAIPAAARSAMASCMAVQAMLLPIFVQTFHRIAPWTLWANLLALPLTGLLTLTGFLLTLVSPLPYIPVILGWLATRLCRVLLWVAQGVAALPGSDGLTASVPESAVWIWFGLLVWLRSSGSLPGALRWRMKPAGAAVLIGLVVLVCRMPPGKLQITFLDVGQGDAAILRFPDGRSLMVDTGGNARAGRDDTVGPRVDVPALLSLGIASPDDILVTHGHSDHAGALEGVLDAVGTGRLLIPDAAGALVGEPEQLAHRLGIEVVRLSAGDVPIRFPGGEVRILYPPTANDAAANDTAATDPAEAEAAEPNRPSKVEPSDPNDLSAVLSVSYGDFVLLMTGDTGSKVETELIRSGLVPETTVLKVGHHGSASASSSAFLAASRPEWAVIGAGKNSYGLPAESARERLADAGAQILVTRENGSIQFETDGRNLRVRTWLDAQIPWLQRLLLPVLFQRSSDMV